MKTPKEYFMLKDLKEDFPLIMEMVESENSTQYPNAKFVKAVLGREYKLADSELTIVYDFGHSEDVLYICVCAAEDGDIVDSDRAYIDEYQEKPAGEIPIFPPEEML